MSTSENVSSGASSRKEKKKQAKEERDRLKQVEKKKRRLEKALATATAIRIELEKKKQRRKEEEQRLDAEGAALAEAVALQVLVDEEVISFDDSLCDCKVPTFSEASRSDGKLRFTMALSKTESVKDRRFNMEDVQVKKLVRCSEWEGFSNPRDNITFSSERAKAAELAAGIAAAQAVAALKIAEEARAEAEAAKKAAEAAIFQVLDRRQCSDPQSDRQIMTRPSNIEVERDELKARLEESERQLREKTRRVFHLEQSLEDMTQYLLQLKSKVPLPSASFEREVETSERGSTNLTGSSHEDT